VFLDGDYKLSDELALNGTRHKHPGHDHRPRIMPRTRRVQLR
jgi:hypothetical protein